MLLVQGQKCSLPTQYTGTGSQSQFWAPGLIYFEVVSYLSTFLGLETFPLFPSVGIFNSLPSGGRDGFDLTITPPFLDLSCSYVEFTICVFHNSYGITKTDIFINTILSSILDR